MIIDQKVSKIGWLPAVEASQNIFEIFHQYNWVKKLNYEKFLLQVKRNSVKSKRELITGNKNRDDHILRTVKLKEKKYQNVNELTKSLNCWCSLI